MFPSLRHCAQRASLQKNSESVELTFFHRAVQKNQSTLATAATTSALSGSVPLSHLNRFPSSSVSHSRLSSLIQRRHVVVINVQRKFDHLVSVHCEQRLLIQVEDEFLHCPVRLVNQQLVLHTVVRYQCLVAFVLADESGFSFLSAGNHETELCSAAMVSCASLCAVVQIAPAKPTLCCNLQDDPAVRVPTHACVRPVAWVVWLSCGPATYLRVLILKQTSRNPIFVGIGLQFFQCVLLGSWIYNSKWVSI